MRESRVKDMPERDADPTRRPRDKAETIVERVRRRYGEIAARKSSCCGAGSTPLDASTSRRLARAIGYDDDQLSCSTGAASLGLGCGAPIELLDLQPGETVLDLGSGAGLDAILAAREVGPEGKVIGVDMTPEMLGRARQNAREAGLPQIEIVEGRLEHLPVPDASIDAVTSNCVINLVPDKARVFREIARVLRPGGRLVISDIVLDRPLPAAIQGSVLAWVGCVAGAARREEYLEQVKGAGLRHVEILKELDLSSLADDFMSGEVAGFMDQIGVSIDELRGTLYSITFRAEKR
ncbi:MAG: arsenite methyltransferase [Acidobacteriota bacterium]|nr:arsenite methyltransferase [Acidobacteriota bacterium]